jgi:hypothetical protein
VTLHFRRIPRASSVPDYTWLAEYAVQTPRKIDLAFVRKLPTLRIAMLDGDARSSSALFASASHPSVR